MANPGLKVRKYGVEHCVLVDDDVYEIFKGKSLSLRHPGYAVLNYWLPRGVAREKGICRRKTLLLHRQVMFAPPGHEIDHINRNKLDCRRGNLRLATRRQNQRNTLKQSNNTTGYKAVFYDKRRLKFFSKTRDSIGKDIYLGQFDTAEEASAAYSAYIRHEFPVFAPI